MFLKQVSSDGEFQLIFMNIFNQESDSKSFIQPVSGISSQKVTWVQWEEFSFRMAEAWNEPLADKLVPQNSVQQLFE